MPLSFTLVSTVFNEASRLGTTIQELRNQTVQPAEIIITDAGSTDGTLEILQEWKKTSAVPVHVLVKERCNVAEGRNMAIHRATYPLIVSTDFGCRFHPQWLESITQPFSDSRVKAVAGAFTVKEEDLTTLSAKAAFLLFDGYKDDIKADWFTPSSRSIAYYKEVFDAAGGYPEWLTLAADDTIFGRLVKKEGYAFYPVEQPFVYWGRHGTALAYAREAFRYGLGDGEAHINIRSTIAKAAELCMRLLFITATAGLGIMALNSTLPWYAWLVPLPLLRGFKPYYYHTRLWLKWKSPIYNTRVFVYGFYLLERTRWHYLKGYYKGYVKSPGFRKEAAAALQKRWKA